MLPSFSHRLCKHYVLHYCYFVVTCVSTHLSCIHPGTNSSSSVLANRTAVNVNRIDTLQEIEVVAVDRGMLIMRSSIGFCLIACVQVPQSSPS